MEHLEPDSWDFNKDGLYIWPSKKKDEKRCIDKALKKLYGKDWNKPTSATRFDFKKK